MDEVEDATLAEEDVVVELLGESFPELQRMLIDRGALIPEVVGANDGGVASHVAPRQPAPLQHRNISDRSEEHTSELQSRPHLVCRLLLEKKNKKSHKTL